MRLNIFLILIFSLLQITCQSDLCDAPVFDEFRQKDKFSEEEYYTGLGDPSLKPVLTENLNLTADLFQEVYCRDNSTNEEYLEALDKGLSQFENYRLKLDTEDRERVCMYFVELMDIVGLESSEGKLNFFLYGFTFPIPSVN